MQYQGLIGQDNNPTGFTNTWLEERSHKNLFIKKYKDFSLFEEDKNKNNATNIVSNMFENVPLSNVFFSDKNINHIKILLCNIIKNKNGYIITPESQSSNEILTVMRSIYLVNTKNFKDNLAQQLKELNYMVLMDIYPRTLVNIRHYLSYIKDHGSRPLMLSQPQYVGKAGTRTNRGFFDKML